MSEAESFDDRTEPAPAPARAADGQRPVGGSLGRLLDAARAGQVDLARLRLAGPVEAALRSLAALPRLEDRAEGLRVAAELIALKARLLAARPGSGAAAEEAASLHARHARLERLTFLQAAGRALMERPQLGQDVFARGAPEFVGGAGRKRIARLGLLELVRAWAALRSGEDTAAPLRIRSPAVMTLREALVALEAALAGRDGWTQLEGLVARPGRPVPSRSARAAALCAALELVWRGRIEIRQTLPAGPVEARRVAAGPDVVDCGT